MPRQLTVFVRQHCHLCDEMVRALRAHQPRYGFETVLIDIDDDAVLAARYGEKVPVLAEGDVEICHYFLRDDALTAHLGPPLDTGNVRGAARNARIYAITRQIPVGRVATYGQIAAIEGRCTPRMVGNAMAALPAGADVPWQRVINAKGELSPRGDGSGTDHQRERLAAEGVFLDRRGRVDFARVGWDGPDARWLTENDCEAVPRAGTRRA